jgi:hypothetical protein
LQSTQIADAATIGVCGWPFAQAEFEAATASAILSAEWAKPAHPNQDTGLSQRWLAGFVAIGAAAR